MSDDRHDVELSHFDGWSSMPVELQTEVGALRHEHLLAVEGKTLADYQRSDARAVHIVARAGGRVVGYVQYDPDTGRLRQLVVVPERRGSGLGLRLVGAVEDEVRRRGRDDLIVHAWVESAGFYARTGFDAGMRVAGEGAERDWVRMRKRVALILV